MKLPPFIAAPWARSASARTSAAPPERAAAGWDLRAVFEGAPEPAWIADTEGRLAWCNARWREHTGLGDEASRGHGWRRALEGPHAAGAVERWEASLAAGEGFTLDLPLRGADGESRWFRAQALPLRGAGGRVEAWLCALSDVDDARRELEAFADAVARNLRAPLRHVAGFAELLDRRAHDRLDAQARVYLARIAEAARRGARLVDDLLAFARTGRVEVRRAPVDLNVLVDEVRRELLASQGDREVVWRVGPLPRVEGDAELLRLALRNLLANALKYSRGPRAVVEVGSREGAGEVEVYVRDHGVGFPMDRAGDVFRAFRRLDPSREREGAGVGLATVRRVVQRHGGRAWAEATPDAGATFHFTLPRGPR